MTRTTFFTPNRRLELDTFYGELCLYDIIQPMSAVAKPFYGLEGSRDWTSMLDFIQPLADAGRPNDNPIEALARITSAYPSTPVEGLQSLGTVVVIWVRTRV